MKKISKNKIMIIVIILLSLFLIYKLPKMFINKNKEPIIKEVKKDKTFAIMIQSGDTYKEYTSTDNKWPDGNYIFSKAECVDNAGNKVEDAIIFNNETRKATLKSKKTIYCTLYFDESNIVKLRKEDTNRNLSPEPNQGGMYRYQGTDNVSNWICFGTTDNCGINDELIDKYMYRIIGVTSNGELYLIKETFLKEGEIRSFAWNDTYMNNSTDSSNVCSNGKCPEWNESLLFKRINGISNGNLYSKDANAKANTDIFVDSNEYEYLKSGDNINGGNKASEWYNLIANHEWMYGDTALEYSDINLYNSKNMYDIETGAASTFHYNENKSIENYQWLLTNKVTAKISLMYIHDYLYAYPNSNPGNYDNAKNSWIFFQKNQLNNIVDSEWLSTRWGLSANTDNVYDSRFIYSNGTISNYALLMEFGVRPVFYLLPKVKIANGNGTKENPFIIDNTDNKIDEIKN